MERTLETNIPNMRGPVIINANPILEEVEFLNNSEYSSKKYPDSARIIPSDTIKYRLVIVMYRVGLCHREFILPDIFDRICIKHEPIFLDKITLMFSMKN